MEHSVVNEHRLYTCKDGIYSQNTEVKKIKHSTDTSLPTFVIDENKFEDKVSEAFSIGIGIMLSNDLNQICLIGKNTLVNYYMQRSEDSFAIKAEEGFDIMGPLYGLNLSSSY